MPRANRLGKSVLGGLVVDLVESQERLREIQREIGRMNNRTQIEYLMENRQDLLAKIETLRSEVARKIPDSTAANLRIFQCIYRVISVYGRGVSESILWSFECEAKTHPLELVNYPKTFTTCLEKTFGKRSSKEMENTMIFELANEFGLQLSKRANLGDAIKLAASSMSPQDDEENMRARSRSR